MSDNLFKKEDVQLMLIGTRPSSDIAGDHYDTNHDNQIHKWECECGIWRIYYKDPVQCPQCGCLGIPGVE